MVLRKKTITLEDGKKIQVEVFDTKLTVGNGQEIDSIESLFREEEIEKKIQIAIKKISSIAKKYRKKYKDLDYCFEVGKVLQFVDEEELTKKRGLIWERMADNLRPELFGGKKRDAQESKRFPEFMYLLGKQSRKNLHRASWDQWYEITKFTEEGIPKVLKNPSLLEKILLICETKNPSGRKLRDMIHLLKDGY